MAIFGTNRCSVLEGVEVEADMSYAGIEGCSRALLEAKENDQALFVGVMTNDIQSILTEDWEQREAINEASVKGVWTSVVKIFEKLLAKVKGIIATATAKFTQVISDGERLYKMHKKNLDGKNLSECRTKVREFDKATFDSFKFTGTTLSAAGLGKTSSDNGDDLDKALAAVINTAFSSQYRSAKGTDSADKAFDKCFSSEKTVSVSIDGWVKDTLSKAFLNSIIKGNKEIESGVAKLVADAKKNEKTITANNAKAASKNTSDATKDIMDGAENTAAMAVKVASALQTEVITFTTARVNCAKKAIIQAKKVFTAAVAYKAKKEDTAKAKEEAKNEGFEFIEESVNYAGLYEVLGEASYVEAALIAETETELALS